MDYKLLLDTAVAAGVLMLENGAEIYRVEDTIAHILRKSGLKIAQSYVVPTGIMVTLDDPAIDSLTVIRRVKERTTNLSVIDQVNDISRKFCRDEITLKEAFRSLKYVNKSQYSSLCFIFAMGLCSGSFSVLFSGGLKEAFVAFVVGILSGCLVLLGKRWNFNQFILNIFSSMAIAMVSVFFAKLPWCAISINPVVIGAIMPMVPGAAITNAMRDMLQGDYNASGAKILEAFVIAASIATGVALGFIVAGGIGL